MALVPPGFVTVTSTGPALPAGEVTSTSLGDTLESDVPRLGPKCTAVVPARLPPKIRTRVPPGVGPLCGAMLDTEGRLSYVKMSRPLTRLVPEGVVTVTSTAPALPAGEVMSRPVGVMLANDVPRLAPKCTAVAPLRLEPLTCTRVPPAVSPVEGDRTPTTG